MKKAFCPEMFSGQKAFLFDIERTFRLKIWINSQLFRYFGEEL